MLLDIQVSTRMTKFGEDDVVRLSSGQRNRLGVLPGGRIQLTTHAGTKVSLSVEDVHVEDVISDKTSAWVSQPVFDTIVGIPTDPGTVTLGCDPEFIFLDNRRRVLPANYWLPTKGAIGSDGPLAELRPAPGEHETEVVENLRSLIKALPWLVKSRFKNDPVVAEGHSCWENYAIGFHIHIGAPRELVTYAARHSRQFIRSFITALDYFVGIPAMLLEDTNTRRLGNGMYGKPGDFRVTNRTIEYRTPGGFHLRHPEYAAGIMALALCASREILEDARKESNGWRDMDLVAKYAWIKEKFGLPSRERIWWALSEATKQEAVKLLPQLIPAIKQLRYFDEHAPSIRNYFNLILHNRQYSPSLSDNW